MRKALDGGDPGRVLRLGIGQPAQLGRGDRRHRNGADRPRPGRGPGCRVTTPQASRTRSAAAAADRVSFHSRAGRMTCPDESRHTMPCCCPATDNASTSATPPAAWSARLQRHPPPFRVDLRAVGVRGAATAGRLPRLPHRRRRPCTTGSTSRPRPRASSPTAQEVRCSTAAVQVDETEVPLGGLLGVEPVSVARKSATVSPSARVGGARSATPAYDIAWCTSGSARKATARSVSRR